MIDLLKGYFKVGDRDDHREMRAKVLERVLGLDRALERLLPPLLALLDLPAMDLARRLAESVRRMRQEAPLSQTEMAKRLGIRGSSLRCGPESWW